MVEVDGAGGDPCVVVADGGSVALVVLVDGVIGSTSVDGADWLTTVQPATASSTAAPATVNRRRRVLTSAHSVESMYGRDTVCEFLG